MLATFGLQRLESSLEDDTVSAADVAEFFDQAEADGAPIPHTILNPAIHAKKALPLDQLIINFR